VWRREDDIDRISSLVLSYRAIADYVNAQKVMRGKEQLWFYMHNGARRSTKAALRQPRKTYDSKPDFQMLLGEHVGIPDQYYEILPIDSMTMALRPLLSSSDL
jgi:hypothetical protein